MLQWRVRRRLTVKLRGRTEAPDGAEGAQCVSARGANAQAHHGPLQRLLAASSPTELFSQNAPHLRGRKRLVCLCHVPSKRVVD
jgi:hypothetical protein